jgi:hypothetical protein
MGAVTFPTAGGTRGRDDPRVVGRIGHLLDSRERSRGLLLHAKSRKSRCAAPCGPARELWRRVVAGQHLRPGLWVEGGHGRCKERIPKAGATVPNRGLPPGLVERDQGADLRASETTRKVTFEEVPLPRPTPQGLEARPSRTEHGSRTSQSTGRQASGARR